MPCLVPHASERSSALALRVAELSSVLKQQRDQIEEQQSSIDHSHMTAHEHREIIRLQVRAAPNPLYHCV